jgi:hypothetical protein
MKPSKELDPVAHTVGMLTSLEHGCIAWARKAAPRQTGPLVFRLLQLRGHEAALPHAGMQTAASKSGVHGVPFSST